MASIHQIVAVNVSMATSGNEYSISLPPGSKNLHLKCRDTTNAIKVYMVSVGNGGSPANYFTIAPNTTLSFDTVFGGQTMYLMGTVSTLVLEACYVIDP